MADADTVRGAGVPERLPLDPGAGDGMPADPGQAMTLIDHLSELRTRIVRAILAVVAGSAIGFAFAEQIQTFLIGPLPPSALPLQTLAIGDAFAIRLRIAVTVGIILAMPVLLYQVWSFVAPGLTAGERRSLRPWIPLALFFFVLGVSVAWIILPFTIAFLLGFTNAVIVDRLTATNYFDFVTTMFLAFGLLMEFPIVLFGLARVGILSSTRLAASRRFALIGIAIFAAVVTPGGDPVSFIVLGATMYLLFEATVFAIRRGGR